MADGIKCKHCGWQESSHELLGRVGEICEEDANQHIPGYRLALVRCTGFEPPKRMVAKSKRHERFEEACLDRRAQGAVACGAYSAQCRQAKFDEELAGITDKDARTSVTT